MTALSLSLPWRKKKAPEPPSLADLLFFVRYEWRSDHGLVKLGRLLELEPDPSERVNAVYQFLFNAPKDLEKEPQYEVIVKSVLAEITAGQSIVRQFLTSGQYDPGFLQNIAVWQARTKYVPPSTPFRLTGTTAVCISRMSAVENCFSNEVSNEAVEVAIAFLMRILTTEQQNELSDNAWSHCFEVGKQFAQRRPSKSLTLNELVRLRDAATIYRAHLALVVQREISALS